jgi:hypothetical protein
MSPEVEWFGACYIVWVLLCLSYLCCSHLSPNVNRVEGKTSAGAAGGSPRAGDKGTFVDGLSEMSGSILAQTHRLPCAISGHQRLVDLCKKKGAVAAAP